MASAIPVLCPTEAASAMFDGSVELSNGIAGLEACCPTSAPADASSFKLCKLQQQAESQHHTMFNKNVCCGSKPAGFGFLGECLLFT